MTLMNTYSGMDAAVTLHMWLITAVCLSFFLPHGVVVSRQPVKTFHCIVCVMRSCAGGESHDDAGCSSGGR